MERKPGESLFQYAMRVSWFTGQFWKLPDGGNVKQADLSTLKSTDDIAVRALIELAKSDVTAYTIKSLDSGHDPDFVGALNPGLGAMLDVQRCPVPDVAPPLGVSFLYENPDLQTIALRMQQRQVLAAIGTGNWPNCHGVNGFHCVAQQVNPAGMHPRVVPLWKTIMQNVQKAYARIGLLWLFIGMDGKDLLTGGDFDGKINTKLTFVSSLGGPIGLAVVGQGEGCDDEIWGRLLSSYLGGSTDAQIIMQVGALLTHENAHNAGLGHTNGGIQNPSIGSSSPVGEWPENDPSTPKLKILYGGVPVPIPGAPGPGPAPPPSTVESRLRAVEIENAIQSATLAWCVNKIKNLL